MSWVDLAVIGVVLISGLLAFARGFVREVLGIGAWIGAAIVSIWAFPAAQPQFQEWMDRFHQPDLVMPVTYGAVFVAALLVLLLVTSWISSLVQDSILGSMDRTLGLLFGLLRGAVLICIVYAVAGMAVTADKWPAQVLQARLLPLTYTGATWLMGLLPENYRHQLPPPVAPNMTEGALLQPEPTGRASDPPVVR